MGNRKILITGASGNIGYEIIRGLKEINSRHSIIAADHKPERAKKVLNEFKGLEYRTLDFVRSKIFAPALKGVDVVFLLRPPNLADVPKFFEPFVDAMIDQDIRKIVFLSVQGVENQKRIPHHKLEKLILDKSLEYAFLRPSYFMQNLTTTLKKEITEQDKIFIPSGKLKFTWVDAKDIGLVGAHILDKFDNYRNGAYEITGTEQKDFYEVAEILTEKLAREIRYESPNLIRFFRHKRKQGMPKMMIIVMIMLHYLPRFSKKENKLTNTVQEIAGKEPGSLESFIERSTMHLSGA